MIHAVEINNLTKNYHANKALDDFSVVFREGKVTGLLGPNGAGKSTLFKVMTGLVKPTSGSVSILGQTPSWSTNTDIAYLPDRSSWYGFYTVEEALNYAAKIFTHFNLQRALKLAADMGLELSSKVSSLSKGMEARLLLILCLARNTKILLLDEPFSGIDLVSREKIIAGIIDSITEHQQTIIISTHEIHEAESLFDEVVFINQGKLILSGETEALRAQEGSIESVYRRLFR